MTLLRWVAIRADAQDSRRLLLVGALMTALLCGACATTTTTTTTTSTKTVHPSAGPTTTLHYTANGVFDSSGAYTPRASGFNLVDVQSPEVAAHLPAGTRGLVWLDLCTGTNATFTDAVTPYVNNPKVFGYYLVDEPDPTGKWKPRCNAADLKAESSWIHAHDPGKRTYLMLMNMSSSAHPSYRDTYNPANTGIDLFGLDPYPCRSELNGCDYSYITKSVAAAEAAGIPATQLVPTYQTFGGGTWAEDGGGSYVLPSSAQLHEILSTWGSVLPHPEFDYAYSWGTQRSDTSLDTSAALLPIIRQHNAT